MCHSEEKSDCYYSWNAGRAIAPHLVTEDITWYIRSPESCNWFYLVLFSHKWRGSRLVMVEPPIVWKFGSAKLNPKVLYSLLEPFDVFFLLSISVQCLHKTEAFLFFLLIQPNSLTHQFYYFQVLTESIICPPTFPNQGVNHICFSHLYCFSLFSFIVQWFQTLWSGLPSCLPSNSWVKKGLQLIKNIVHGKQPPLEPILLEGKYWPSG